MHVLNHLPFSIPSLSFSNYLAASHFHSYPSGPRLVSIISWLALRYSTVPTVPKFLTLSVWIPTQFFSFFILSPAQFPCLLVLATLKHTLPTHRTQTPALFLPLSKKKVYLVFSFTGTTSSCLSTGSELKCDFLREVFPNHCASPHCLVSLVYYNALATT